MDYFSFVKKRGRAVDGYLKYITSSYKSYGPLKYTMSFLLGIFFKRVSYKNKKYVFLSSKYSEIIKCFSPEDVLIIGGLKDSVFCLKKKLAFLPVPFNTQKELASELEGRGIFKDERIDLGCIKNTLKNSHLPILFLSTDSLPYERFLINNLNSLLGNKIIIQHGIIQSNQVTDLEDGLFSDFILTYNDFQKNIYEKYLSEKSDVKCINFGFYKDIEYIERRKEATYDVCIVGQPFGKINKYYHEEYVKLLNVFHLRANKEGLSVCYKPHPGEGNVDDIKELFDILAVNYEDSFSQADAYVSFTSTYLYEANLRGCKVYQIKTSSIPQDIYFKTIELSSETSLKEIFTCTNNVTKRPPLSKRIEKFMTEYDLVN